MSAELVTYEFVLEARTPIAHHSETIGNTQVLMTRKHRTADGRWVNLPVISGDTMRHGLRDAGMRAYLDAAGVQELSLPALRLLFNGGVVMGSAGGTVSIRDYKTMVDLCPPLGLLGGCVSNRIVPGRMTVDEAVLICDESTNVLPDWVHEWMGSNGGTFDPLKAHVEEATRVRMDPALDPEKRTMLTQADDDEVARMLSDGEDASLEGDVVLAEKSKSTLMPRSFERVAAGSLFYWRVSARVQDDLMLDTFHVMLSQFLGNAWVGGKRGTGHGNLKPVTARKMRLSLTMELEDVKPDAVAPRVGGLFQRHVKDRAEQIGKFLAEVAA